MDNMLGQILGIIRLVADDEEKLEKILEFLETEILDEEQDFFPKIDLPEQYIPVINSIAQDIDMGMVCFFNPETLETESIPVDFLSEIDDCEPEESRERMRELYDWEEIKFLDWDTRIEFHPISSNEGYRIMESFAERLKDDDDLKSELFNALDRRRPFANFNDIIHNSDKRNDWFEFKQKWLENIVANQLSDELTFLENQPKFESGIYNDDGTKVDESSIPVPNLCVVCKKRYSDDWEEDILCKMNRHDQRDDLDNFQCGAFENI